MNPLQAGYAEMFGEYPHQLTVGLRFHRAGTNIHTTRQKINEFVRDLAK